MYLDNEDLIKRVEVNFPKASKRIEKLHQRNELSIVVHGNSIYFEKCKSGVVMAFLRRFIADNYNLN